MNSQMRRKSHTCQMTKSSVAGTSRGVRLELQNKENASIIQHVQEHLWSSHEATMYEGQSKLPVPPEQKEV